MLIKVQMLMNYLEERDSQRINDYSKRIYFYMNINGNFFLQ